MRALYIQHDHRSPLGAVGERFAERGYQPVEFGVVPAGRYHRPDVTARFPDPAGFDAIVVLGAVWAVYDEPLIGRWLRPELDLLRAAHAAGVPLLGICFGGQALAAALGGTVAPAAQQEIGWHQLHSDDPALIDPGPWYEFHYDQFTVPPGAAPLAATPACPQAFAAGRSLGVQFHPEVTPAVLACWFSEDTAELAQHGLTLPAVLAEAQAHEQAATARAHRLVDTFIDEIAGSPHAP